MTRYIVKSYEPTKLRIRDQPADFDGLRHETQVVEANDAEHALRVAGWSDQVAGAEITRRWQDDEDFRLRDNAAYQRQPRTGTAGAYAYREDSEGLVAAKEESDRSAAAEIRSRPGGLYGV